MEISNEGTTVVARRSLDVFFSESVRRFPDRPALFVSGQYWSYDQLDAECKAIEATLRAAGLTGGNCNIGLIYARGMLSYAAIIAIMRSDHVYVPLNGALPAERLLRIIEDAGIETVIIDSSMALSEGERVALQKSKPLRILVATHDSNASFDSIVESAPQHRLFSISYADVGSMQPQETRTPPTLTRLAYIIYTSGSTGVPKGVAITHESAYRCIEKSHRLFGTSEQDRFTQFSALSFDVSILDLFLCWKSGGTLYVPADQEAILPIKFAVTHEITVWSSVPSLANFLLKMKLLKSDALPRIRMYLFCGEALPIELAQACLNAASSSRVFNLYGPTECTIFATYHEYDRAEGEQGGIVPIGVPLSGLRCMIVNDGHVVEAADEPGELWLTGDQLAVEYWKNPAATQSAFVPFQSNDSAAEVWYRTGDLVSRRHGVGLLFRGRLDRQIKLRGFRVELQEIESALRGIIGCSLVAAIPIRNSGGIWEKVIAYCDTLNADESTIKARCLSRLPQYMVPDRIIELDHFPLSASGKIDYLALSARSTSRSGA